MRAGAFIRTNSVFALLFVFVLHTAGRKPDIELWFAFCLAYSWEKARHRILVCSYLAYSWEKARHRTLVCFLSCIQLGESKT